MGNYICNQCNKEFSRKWNVLRHNKQIHHGLAIIYNKTTGFTIRDSMKENDIPIINSLAEELNIDKICGKFFQPLTELEKVLDDMPEPERIKYVSNLIVAALNDSDPVELIQYNLDSKRSDRGKQKIISYLAIGKNMNNIQAEHYIKEMIRSSKYFKNYTKLDHTKIKSI